MECYSAIKKNTFESVLMRWIKLEPIIQSEVIQKDKYQKVINLEPINYPLSILLHNCFSSRILWTYMIMQMHSRNSPISC